MKNKFIGLLFVFLFVITNMFSQDSSIVWIYRIDSKTSYDCGCKISIDNQPSFQLEHRQVSKYTFYSSGNIRFTSERVPCELYNKSILDLEIEPGKEYFVQVNVVAAIMISPDTDQFKKDLLKAHYLKFYENKQKPANNSGKIGPSSGTGFLVSNNGYILTNSHVIEGAKKITVKTTNKENVAEYTAKLIAEDKNNDLAILKIEKIDLKLDSLPYSFKNKSCETGEDVFVLGYPLISAMGEELKLTKGVVSSKSGYKGSIGSYQVSAQVQPGNSGSPVFDNNGNLIGVVNSKITAAEGVSYVIKNSYIKAIFENAEINLITSPKSKIENLSLPEKIKILSPFIYIIKVER